jgi:predicted nucleic acid-binding Zn ribbon protein
MKMMSEIMKLVMEKIAATDGYKKNWIHLHWKDVVGKEAGKHSAPRKMEKGMLFVKVDSSSWTYSLFIRKNELMRKINEMFGSSIVTEIKYQAGEIEAEKAERKMEAGQMMGEQSQGRYRTKTEQQVIDFLRKKAKN